MKNAVMSVTKEECKERGDVGSCLLSLTWSYYVLLVDLTIYMYFQIKYYVETTLQ